MKYAIIAAGEGSRLAQEGIAAPKPLVEVNGEKLIDRLIRVFTDCGAEEVCVICRATGDALSPVALHLQELQRAGFPLRFIYKATPSSMHSLFELSPMLEGGPFVLTTVDTIFRETEFRSYVAAFERLIADGEADGLMGVTDYIDDEKPLYVRCEQRHGERSQNVLNIAAFLDHDDTPRYISGGIYGLTPRSLQTLRQCIERGESRMRNFQRALIADGLRLKAYPFSKVLDIDHATDIQKAEEFLGSE
jgi:NDP-sugar pyrophosphorylase family protein